MADNIRIGQGYDVHRLLTSSDPLRIGGVDVPHTKCADGHSDADVLLHALCDALLGALALGDIGQHFPDTDPAYKGIDSSRLLENVYQKVDNAGYKLVNMDAVVCLESPKIAPFTGAMCTHIAQLLHTDVQNVSIKATTGEKMGFVGREEGISAHVVVLLTQKS